MRATDNHTINRLLNSNGEYQRNEGNDHNNPKYNINNSGQEFYTKDG